MTLSVLDAAREAPDRTALVANGECICFEELAASAGAAFASLPPLPEGRLPALEADVRRDVVELIHGFVSAGLPFLPLHPKLTPDEVAALLSACDATPIGAKRAPGRAQLRHGPPAPEVATLAVVATSGSTGEPRGVVLSRGAFSAAAAASAANLGWREDDRWLLSLPLAHVGGLSILTRCLIARRAVVLPEEVGVRATAVEAFVRAVERDRVTLASLVPAQLDALLERAPAWKPPGYLRAVLLGGAAASPALLRRALDRGFPVLATYGMTETCSQVATWRYGEERDASDPLLDVGEPVRGVELRVRDGAVEVRADSLASGYLPPTIPIRDGDGWYATGDAGELDGRGRLRILGRLDDVIVTGGENVHPAEVERALESIPGVRAACVFAVPDPRFGRLVAAAVAVSRPELGAGGIASALQGRIAPFKQPRRIALLEELPLNRAGKPDRAATARRAAGRLEALSRSG